MFAGWITEAGLAGESEWGPSDAKIAIIVRHSADIATRWAVASDARCKFCCKLG